jgi:carboxypeptidase PM20D1
MKRLFASVVLGTVALFALLCARALSVPAPPASPPSAQSQEQFPEAAEHLGAALRFATVSHQDPAQDDRAQLEGLRSFLERTYPRVHAALQREVIGDGALLFTWKGTDASLPPLLLLAHQDVVPVEAGTEQRWTHPPFSGAVAGGFVWGRGAQDDKGSLIAILEAVEHLLAQGGAPKRTVLLAFGHDEEVSGLRGAVQVAALLAQRGVHPLLVLDEGLAITDGLVPGARRPIALIGLAEKGYLTLELVAQGPGGHSSMPPLQTTAGIIAAAVARLEAHPFPTRLSGPARALAEGLAPVLPFGQRLALANLWLLGPVVERIYASTPNTAALVRTTLAATVLEAGTKENVLPQSARAVINLRLLPGDTIASATARVQSVIADARVEVRPLGAFASEASPEAPASGPAYELIAQSIRAVAPDVAVAPSLVLGATDARHYAGLGAPAYRFAPFRVQPQDLGRVHGTDERVSVEGLGEAVRFYLRLLQNGAL